MWDHRFLELAQLVSTWSKDTSTKVGAVIVRPDKTIASVGYNGFARGVLDNPELIANRTTKLLRTIHAEENAILHARERLDDYTLYVTPLHPCSTCAAKIIQVGIKRIVTVPAFVDRWQESFDAAAQQFAEAGVAVTFLSDFDQAATRTPQATAASPSS